MRIDRFDLLAYGPFTQRTLNFADGRDKLSIVYGENEAGKSTTLRAIAAFLFGFPSRIDDDYLHPSRKLRLSAKLSNGGSSLDAVRRKGNKNTLSTPAGEPLAEDSLDAFLDGVRRDEFVARFGLSHDELVAGGRAVLEGGGDLGQLLFAAGAGIGKLRDLETGIDAEARELFVPRGSKPKINASLSGLDVAKRELRDSQLRPGRFVELKQQLEDAKQQSREFSRQRADADAKLKRLLDQQKALPLLGHWQRSREQLSTLEHVVDLDEAFRQRRREKTKDRDLLRSTIDELGQRIDGLQRELDRDPPDEAVLDHAADIETLRGQVSVQDKATADCQNLIRIRRGIVKRLRQLAAEMRLDLDAESDADWVDSIRQKAQQLQISESNARRISELSHRHETLIENQRKAIQDCEVWERRGKELEDKRPDSLDVIDVADLERCLRQVGDPKRWVDDWDQLDNDQNEGEDRVRRHAREVGMLDTDVDGDRNQVPQPPPSDRIEAIAGTLAEQRKRIERAAEQHERVTAELDDLKRRRTQDADGTDVPSEEDLRVARQQRDALLTDEPQGSGPARESTPSYWSEIRQRVRHADATVDQMRRHHEFVVRRHQWDQQEKRLRETLAASQQEIDHAKKQSVVSREEWSNLWKRQGFATVLDDGVAVWHSQYENLVDATESLASLRKRRADAGAKIRRIIDELKEHAQLAEEASDARHLDRELTRIHAKAEARCQKWAESNQRIKAWRESREQIERARQNAQRQLAESKVDLENWQRDWTHMTGILGDFGDDPVQASERIRQIDRLNAESKEAATLNTRIASITEDADRFLSMTKRLAMTLQADAPESAASGSDIDVATAAQWIASWYRRLQEEQAAARQRNTLAQQIDAAQAECKRCEQSLRQCEVELLALCREGKVETEDQLPAAEERAAEKRVARQNLSQVEQQLSLLAGKQSIDAFVESIRDLDETKLATQIDEVQFAVADFTDKLEASNREVGALQSQLDGMDGSARAAQKSQEIQSILGDTGHDIRRYAVLRLAAAMMREAMDEYRKENQSPILDLAQETFASLTCQKYTGLRPEPESKGRVRLVVIEAGEGGNEVPANQLSTGTADSLYLALRIASLRHQMAQGTTMPLIVDDCLVQMDNSRSAAALEVFGELAKQTQVILFTHHQHLVDLSTQTLGPDQVHVQTLG